ncbi:putative fungal-specific transcription factor [Aspergillus bertholletiae]|uniref:Putative fungal-specific transcription factor n=1 Tax=Aspergillus bertholletiae TaxID=1226010 RepID=A0A5N7AQP5_9EURO|nr:putative fungal-specific transcription factor [Aspergillus bertholletiae]
MKSISKEMVRKNGKPISCEPCRVSKIRCDHQQPTCRRCDIRGLSSKCYYHPAPLTRPRKKAQAPRSVSPVNPPREDDEILDASINRGDSVVPNGSQMGLTPTSQPTYLGSTSFMSAFHHDQQDMSLSTPKTAHASTLRKAWSADFTHVFPRLVQLLRPLRLYEDLVTDQYHRSPFAVIPAPLVLTPLRLLRNHWDTEGWPQEGLGSRITQNTATQLIPIEANMTTDQFYHWFTGANLRWEFVGLIFALAGLGASVSSSSPLFSLNGKDEISSDAFAMEMAAASHACLEICRQYDNVNDLVVWLNYTYYVLSSNIMGETSHQIYAQFGDLVSCIHAMGLHRPHPLESSIPFFLSQARKRIFAASYRTDKNLATFLGRPPRLPYHYCDVGLPLDLDDHTLVLDPVSLDRAVRQLTPDGWGTVNGGLRPATVIRLRYMVARLREQVMELSLGRGSVGSRQNELQSTYQECKHLWDRVPSELHYSKHSWEVLGPHLSIISLVIHLEYLYTVFQVERIRCSEGPNGMTDLLDSAMQIVSAVTDFAKQRDHKGSIREQYTWIFLFYALPAAGVVATELHRCTISRVPLPCSVPRSRIIRDLSLLVSWFETASPLTSGTHQACVGVTKVMIRLLDDTLDYPPDGSMGEGPQLDPGNRPAASSERVRDHSHTIGVSLNAYEQNDTIPNVDSLETSEDFLNWLDELGLETSVPEFFRWQ